MATAHDVLGRFIARAVASSNHRRTPDARFRRRVYEES